PHPIPIFTVTRHHFTEGVDCFFPRKIAEDFRMQQLKPVNVVIAGGGFVGLTLAKEITTRTSLQVVVLERGQPRKLSDYVSGMDELDQGIRLRMMQNLAEETMTHRHSLRASAVPIRQYGSFQPGTGVGGAGEHWGAISYRFYPEHFKLGTFLG